MEAATLQEAHPISSELVPVQVHDDGVELSIVIPCLNEAETIGRCIRKCMQFLKGSDVRGEVIIADNGSTDGSQDIARALGARVVDVPERGYGAAIQGGIRAARAPYIAMGDADDSYDFLNLEPFLDELRAGADLVMGNRFDGGIAMGAMPRLHRYLGNPVLSFLGRLFFKARVGDFHCGLRAFRKDAIEGLGLVTPGMEFASEMVVKSAIHNLDIREVPTTLRRDGRSRPPHLRTWRDGWRHLRFLLIYAPTWLYFYPGLLLCAIGLASILFLLPSDLRVGGVELSIHSLLFAAAATSLGVQLLSFALLARQYGIRIGLWPQSELLRKIQHHFTVERACIVGSIMLLGAFGLGAVAMISWARGGYGPMNPSWLMRLTIPAALLASVGPQIIFTSFFAALLGQKDRS